MEFAAAPAQHTHGTVYFARDGRSHLLAADSSPAASSRALACLELHVQTLAAASDSPLLPTRVISTCVDFTRVRSCVSLAEGKSSSMDSWLRREGSSSSVSCDLFTDAGFPPNSDSIDGRQLSTIKGLENSSACPPQAVVCACKKPSILRKVSKEGPNSGRYFYSCEQRTCSFFKWGDFAPHDSSLDSIDWQRFRADEGWSVVSASRAVAGGARFEFSPLDVRQGGVGDCWFLSALAVVAERSDLINAIVLTKPDIPASGRLDFRLFIDGAWTDIFVDSFLPCKSPEIGSKRKSPHRDDSLLFSHAAGRQLWVPFLEKAYAKAHRSYRGISGGFIAEAMLDLTGLPCEVIRFSARGFSSELTFERLLSFKANDFPMGCSSFALGEGIVGGHAYSILDVREIADCRVAEQLSLDQLFGSTDGSVSRGARDAALDIYTDNNSIRLLRIRNPWGHKEWSGLFSHDSSIWTSRLRKQLAVGEKNDGTFWITYHDFLRRFEMVEVCKAHRGWAFAKSVGGCTEPKGHLPTGAFSVTLIETSWLYLTVIQKTKRGRNFNAEDRNYWYSAMQLLVVDAASGLLVASRLGSAVRDTEVLELQLPPGHYLVIPLHFRAAFRQSTEKPEPFVTRVVACYEILVEPLHRESLDAGKLSDWLLRAVRGTEASLLFSHTMAPRSGVADRELGSCTAAAIDLCSSQPDELTAITETADLQILRYAFDGISFLSLRNSTTQPVDVDITLETCNFSILSIFSTASHKNYTTRGSDTSRVTGVEQPLRKTIRRLVVSVSSKSERLIAIAIDTQLYEGLNGASALFVAEVSLGQSVAGSRGDSSSSSEGVRFVYQEISL